MWPILIHFNPVSILVLFHWSCSTLPSIYTRVFQVFSSVKLSYSNYISYRPMYFWFYISWADLCYLLNVGVGGFCCTWLHSMIHTLGRTPLDEDKPVAETSTWHHTTLTRDRHPIIKAYVKGTNYEARVHSSISLFPPHSQCMFHSLFRHISFIIQSKFIPKYCTLYTIYKLLQHVSANICSHIRRGHRKVMFI
jgi:hypothetical protein